MAGLKLCSQFGPKWVPTSRQNGSPDRRAPCNTCSLADGCSGIGVIQFSRLSGFSGKTGFRENRFYDTHTASEDSGSRVPELFAQRL